MGIIRGKIFTPDWNPGFCEVGGEWPLEVRDGKWYDKETGQEVNSMSLEDVLKFYKEGNSLKTLSEYNTAAFDGPYVDPSKPVKNGLACDGCFAELFDTYPTMVLASNPPQKNVHCEECGFVGFRVL